MSPSDAAAVHEASPVAPSAAQVRVITAALDLFARHGVGGTSLQMIADEIGVTKAAVYHQFNTKDEIVLAAAEAELARLAAVIHAAETESSRTRARDARLRTVMLIAAISGAVTHPFVVDLDDEMLRTELVRLARRFLGLRG